MSPEFHVYVPMCICSWGFVILDPLFSLTCKEKFGLPWSLAVGDGWEANANNSLLNCCPVHTCWPHTDTQTHRDTGVHDSLLPGPRHTVKGYRGLFRQTLLKPREGEVELSFLCARSCPSSFNLAFFFLDPSFAYSPLTADLISSLQCHKNWEITHGTGGGILHPPYVRLGQSDSGKEIQVAWVPLKLCD